jgi:hypothetical protein
MRALGLNPDELRGKPYAAFWNPTMAPLAAHVRDALARGPIAPPLLPPLASAPRLLAPGDHAVETGFTLDGRGALHVAVQTDMPGASPAMLDWWFGWHGSEAARYKLWHPRAHVHAAWGAPAREGTRGRARYVGRISYVEEYIGGRAGRYAIRFVPPTEVGLDAEALADPEESTAICARVGFADYPVDFGYLIHHVRRTERGAEMRSRFWVGGPYAGARSGSRAGAIAARIARVVRRPSAHDGHALLVHCAEEMAHLASFLPRLYAALGDTE